MVKIITYTTLDKQNKSIHHVGIFNETNANVNIKSIPEKAFSVNTRKNINYYIINIYSPFLKNFGKN